LNIEVQDLLNNSVIKKITNMHNVEENKNRLDLKNELVIKRGLFLAKKRYALYIISQEGNKTDTIKAMGLEIKRSDFSKTTKDYLNEVLKLILKSEKLSVPKVVDYVKEKEFEFSKILSSRITRIGRPVSFSKKLKEYKTISQGVKSMLNWNNLEYKVFDVGSRGYLFKLKGIDLNKAPELVIKNFNEHFLKKGVKLETIAVPEEVENLPLYYIIDIKDMLKFAWIDRYSLLLEPLLTKKQEILTFD
jgi:DNA polymerase elongation subunit (family B)